MPNLNLADLDLLFKLISLSDGFIDFLLELNNNFSLFSLDT